MTTSNFTTIAPPVSIATTISPQFDTVSKAEVLIYSEPANHQCCGEATLVLVFLFPQSECVFTLLHSLLGLERWRECPLR